MAVMRSSVSKITWPAIPGRGTAQVMALLYQLEHSQWDTPEVMSERQDHQLACLLTHALATVPYCQEQFAGSGRDVLALLERWSELPILTRAAVQRAGQKLHSQQVPKTHAAILPVQTSGSTGRPVHALMTGTTQLLHMAMTLREHFWHERDVSGTLVAIRPDRDVDAVDGLRMTTWGRPLDLLFATGPSALLHSNADIGHQLDWLRMQKSTYLLSLPSNLKALAEQCRAHGVRLPGLRAVRCFGERVTPALRGLIRDVWQVPVTDIYSAQEIGTIALQCPEHEHYHLQSESLRVEVLDAAGRPGAPGSIGRVVITPLHNFAMPLIRYEIMDYAELGEPCPCGRGLPVIRRVLGRSRNLATAPDGRRFWPSFPAEAWMDLAPIRQVQLVQRTAEEITVRYVMERTLIESEQAAFTRALHDSLGYPFSMEFVRYDGAIRADNGKYENFISELEAPAP